MLCSIVCFNGLGDDGARSIPLLEVLAFGRDGTGYVTPAQDGAHHQHADQRQK